MRMFQGLIAGALALCGVALAQAPAQARTLSAPELIEVRTVAQAGSVAQPATCYWRRHRAYHRYPRWHRWGYRPYHRWHRPFYGYYRRPFYVHHRPYGWDHRWRHYY